MVTSLVAGIPPSDAFSLDAGVMDDIPHLGGKAKASFFQEKIIPETSRSVETKT
ncbi:MAG: hypothetical protein VKJ63_02960 [Synechococcus sp.]|nr:hypothetical protein [Synechococcus sp.]